MRLIAVLSLFSGISKGKTKYYCRLLVQVYSYNSDKMIWELLTSKNSSPQSDILYVFGELNLTLLEWFCQNNPSALSLCQASHWEHWAAETEFLFELWDRQGEDSHCYPTASLGSRTIQFWFCGMKVGAETTTFSVFNWVCGKIVCGSLGLLQRWCSQIMDCQGFLCISTSYAFPVRVNCFVSVSLLTIKHI